uniref:Uncharacterized protein n=1 Tax=Anopheles albimanus TaxID=7167 RepID=A0A182FQE3_ANOAL
CFTAVGCQTPLTEGFALYCDHPFSSLEIENNTHRQNVGPGRPPNEIPVHLLGQAGPVPGSALLQEPVDLALLLHRIRSVHSAVLQDPQAGQLPGKPGEVGRIEAEGA